MHDLLFLVKVICVFALDRLRAEACSWEAPSDLVDEGMNSVLDDPITGPRVPSGKMRRCRLFAAAVAQLGSKPFAKGQRRATVAKPEKAQQKGELALGLFAHGCKEQFA